MKKFILIVTFGFLNLIFLTSSSVHANEREYKIKAGFIYNFARYSTGEWFDPEKNSIYRICCTNSNFVNTAQITLRNSNVKGVKVQVNHISKPQTGCHTLFVSKGDSTLIINDKVFKNTMIVGESYGFLKTFGHINFFTTSGKIRFEIAPHRLIESQITLSSKVMRMGRLIKDVE